MNSVTVRFAPSTQSQTELQQTLGRCVHALEVKGLAEDAHVEVVFPGDESSNLKGTFVVTFRGIPQRVLDALQQVPGVRSAYAAPERALLRVSSNA